MPDERVNYAGNWKSILSLVAISNSGQYTNVRVVALLTYSSDNLNTFSPSPPYVVGL